VDLNLIDLFLNGMTTYGPLALGLALLLGPLGLPIPTGLLVVAAGAFARMGTLTWSTALAIGLAAVVLGDCASYALGRFARTGVQRTVRGKGAALWEKAQARFKRHGALALYATRVLFTSLDVPTNLIAGGSRYAFGRFLALDVVGRVTWILLYGGLGYAVGSQWAAVSQAISTYSLWLGAAVAAGLGIYYLLRRWRRSRRSDLVYRPEAEVGFGIQGAEQERHQAILCGLWPASLDS
jgi:membrane protein DedA with SNARE-associated domain